MAVVATTTYLYVDTNLTQHFILGAELVDRGAWSSSAFYNVLDAIQIGVDQYVALLANSNSAPTSIVDENWSALVIIEEDSGTTVVSTGSDAYAQYLAELALETAWVGTALGEAAYEIAVIGTAIGSAAYNYAQAAYEIAVIGTNLGSAAYDLAQDAYTIAISTNVSASVGTDAYHLAQIGTNTGTAALNAASSAQSTADSAFSIAVIGTNAAASAQNTANSAFEIAVIGTNESTAAYHLAQIGTNTGTAALNAAASAQSTANSAFSIAVIGTNTGAAAYHLAQIGTNTGTAAYQLAQTGSNLAWSAWEMAQAGTEIPPLSTLPDVSIPSPNTNQALVFDGSQWVAADSPASVAHGAFSYFTDHELSGTLSYYDLLTHPSTIPEHVTTMAIGGATPFVPGRSFITSQLNRTGIDAGIWYFNTFAQVTLPSRTFQVITDVYNRNISGSETYLFSGTSAPCATDTPQMLSTVVTQGSFGCALTDKLVFKYAGLRTTIATTVYIYSAGTAHNSHIITPIGFAHNDLSGIQGGATDERYHTTYDQNQALLGTSGYPSATNPYATYNSLISVTNTGTSSAVAAYTLAMIGTNTGTAAYNYAAAAYALAQSGTNIANSAYLIAVAGTNAVITEQGTRAQEDQYLQNQITALQPATFTVTAVTAGTTTIAAVPPLHRVYLATTTSGTVVVALPNTTGWTGEIIHVKKVTTDGSPVIVRSVTGTATVDGSLEQSFTIPYTSMQVTTDGNNWYII